MVLISVMTLGALYLSLYYLKYTDTVMSSGAGWTGVPHTYQLMNIFLQASFLSFFYLIQIHVSYVICSVVSFLYLTSSTIEPCCFPCIFMDLLYVLAILY